MRASATRRFDWLGDVVARAHLESAHDVLTVGSGGGHQDRQLELVVRLADARENRETIEAFHHDVEQHEIEVLVLESRERGLTALERDDLVAVLLEIALERSSRRPTVVDDQQLRGDVAHGPSTVVAEGPPRGGLYLGRASSSGAAPSFGALARCHELGPARQVVERAEHPASLPTSTHPHEVVEDHGERDRRPSRSSGEPSRDLGPSHALATILSPVSVPVLREKQHAQM